MYSCCITSKSIPACYCHVPYCSHIDQGQFDHSATEHCSCLEAGTAPGLKVIELEYNQDGAIRTIEGIAEEGF